MVVYKPLEIDFEAFKKLSDKMPSDSSILAGYNAFENDENKGLCVFTIENQNCTIYYVNTADNDDLMCEGLIRSALNYSANRGAYMAYCNDISYNNVLSLLGFEKKGEMWQGDIPSLLQGSCCKGK